MIQAMDERILQAVGEHLHTPVLDRLMPAVTMLGNGGVVWLAAAAAMLAAGWFRCGLTMLAALGFGAVVCNVGLKPLVARLRPCDRTPNLKLLVPRPKDYSFPSGHTLSSVAAAVVLLHSFPLLGVAALSLALSIGFSRLYLCVHYPTDVAAGGLLGLFTAWLAIWMVELF